MALLTFLLFGLIVGLITRLIIPGPQPMGLVSTMLLGVGGSLLGGFLGNLVFGGRLAMPVAEGWVGSVIGALLLVALVGRSGWRRSR